MDWSCTATDDAPSMIGRKAGVIVKLREKANAANPEQVFWNFDCILQQEAAARV